MRLCRHLQLLQGSGQEAMRWSGDPQHFPFAGANNVFWNIWASRIPVKYDYVGRLANSNRRLDTYQQRRMTQLPVMSRPASIQGYGQVVVDMPLNNQIPPIKEAADWLILYKPMERVWPPNLLTAMQATRAQRLKLASSPRTLAELTGQHVPAPAPAAGLPSSSSGNNTAGSRTTSSSSQGTTSSHNTATTTTKSNSSRSTPSPAVPAPRSNGGSTASIPAAPKPAQAPAASSAPDAAQQPAMKPAPLRRPATQLRTKPHQHAVTLLLACHCSSRSGRRLHQHHTPQPAPPATAGRQQRLSLQSQPRTPRPRWVSKSRSRCQQLIKAYLQSVELPTATPQQLPPPRRSQRHQQLIQMPAL
ncbi:hypothetical protein COO60DRAFT_1000166 [Scenedesmus sp. NREL 46B-D3]|nr:hypothetical protein COO60DRAFT_1000166 [Scenedesmus sp. NREL 46B-D3]